MRNISEMDIRNYWQIIQGRKYLFISVSILALSVIVWGSYFMPKMYKVKSTVFIERNIVRNLVRGMVITPSINDRLRVLRYSMMSRYMLQRVISALDLDAEAKNPAEIESMIKNFQDKTKIQVTRNDLFTVSYVGKEPRLARDYVNTLISMYIEENTSAKREESFSANQFLSEQIARYKKKLDESSDKLSKYRIEKGLYVAKDENTMIVTMKEYQDKIDNVGIKIKELEAKKEKIRQQLSGEVPFTLAVVDRESGEINIENATLSQRLALLEWKIPMLLTRFTEDYPEVIKTRADIETIKEQIEVQEQDQGSEELLADNSGLDTDMMNPIYQKLKEESLRTESDISSLKAKIATLKNRIEKFKTELRNIPEDRKKLVSLQKERNSNQKVYDQLFSRLGKAEVSKQMELEDKGTKFRIVDPAIMPTKPVSPDRIKFILFGIVAGIAAGIGVVLLMEFLDNSIKGVDALKTSFNLPVLAVIPQIITDKDVLKKRRLDITVYAVSIAYLSVIGVIFMKEIVNRFL